ncbi:hypothetical protein AWC19_27075 [Mycobacterium palustre]|uniref:Uncharacterized protein n=1 Tax=Mycobacterium palustre TaxID=153971 RepID=A0A1X1ZWT8_9MYCO|nr:hypothetical protein AWC19_27075 [Mycobacterium palustre]
MRRIPRGRLTVLVVVLVVVLVGAIGFAAVKLIQGDQGSAPPTAIQPPPPPETYAIPGCYNPSVPPVERPKKLNILGCASVAVALQDMSWTSWGPQGADGTGTAVFKICDPNCAAGYQLSDPVVVHAWNPQPPRPDAICQSGLKIFADIILAFPRAVPPPTAQKMNSQYHGLPAVHYVNYSGANPRDAQFIGYTFCN